MPEGLNITKEQTHLKEGVKPIYASLGTPEDFEGWHVPDKDKFSSKLVNAENIDFYTAHTDKVKTQRSFFKKEEFLNAGQETYVISGLDSVNKFSENFFDCTGIVAAGIDKKTGKEISFLSHQNPLKFLYKTKEDFINHLDQRLLELKDRCEEGTIDVVIVGGTYDNSKNPIGVEHRLLYESSIKLLGEEVKKTLGFEPVIVNGPKTHYYSPLQHNSYPDKVYYDTKNRRLYYMRKALNTNIKDFPPSEFDQEKGKI